MSGISLPYLVEPSTAQGMPIIGPNTALGNISSASAFPAELSKTQITTLINPASTSATGALAALSGLSSDYLGGDGVFYPLIIPEPPPPPTWSVVATFSPTSGGSLLIQNLDDYDELIIVVSNMSISASGTNFSRLGWSFSADNGSNFVNTITWTSANGSILTGQSTYSTGSNTAAVINAMMRLSAFNKSTITPFFTSGTTDVGGTSVGGFVNSNTALNAIRLTPGALSPTIIGGTVTVLAYI